MYYSWNLEKTENIEAMLKEANDYLAKKTIIVKKGDAQSIETIDKVVNLHYLDRNNVGEESLDGIFAYLQIKTVNGSNATLSSYNADKYAPYAKEFMKDLDEGMRAELFAQKEIRLNEERLEEEAKKAALEELRRKKREARALLKAKELKAEDSAKLFDSNSKYFETLGWMTKHIVSIRATMPDTLEGWFVSRFGNVEHNVVDSKKKTSGGYLMSWGLGLTVTFDKELSGTLLEKAKGVNKKVICSVEFVIDLVENHGFQIGGRQDKDAIAELVPDEYLDDFEYGYSL